MLHLEGEKIMILLKTVRIFGFRGLQNIEVDLEPTTILTGMNNSGKSSFFKALQLSLGNTQLVTQDDFFIQNDQQTDRILIDLLIIPSDENGRQEFNFPEEWETVFKVERIKPNNEGYYVIPLRTQVSFDDATNSYKVTRYILNEWPNFINEDRNSWHEMPNGNEKSFSFEEYPFFYIDAQRDILNDIKQKNSFLGKLLSKVEYSPDSIKKIETQIEKLNHSVVENSEILKNVRDTLTQLKSVMYNTSKGVEITPFTKKVRDLNKGVSIYYTEQNDSFSMEYHGMGTRSWSSLLTLKSFIDVLHNNALKNSRPFSPILAIEEPESHLHPNAQKRLFGQINSIYGQKIISTHSPFIPGSAQIQQIRNFYRLKDEGVCCGQIDTTKLQSEEIRKLNRQVISTRGEIYFSKAIVLFEGETEEQALPIFAKKYFNQEASELGINFIGVSGADNYLPFIRFAEAYKIPWFIFSDGEIEIINKLRIQLKTALDKEIDLTLFPNIIIINNGENFETYLINRGYFDEVLIALDLIFGQNYLENYIKQIDGSIKKRTPTSKKCEKCNQTIYKEEIRRYKNISGRKEAANDLIKKVKTQFGPIVAEIIVNSTKSLPSKIRTLFKQVEPVVTVRQK